MTIRWTLGALLIATTVLTPSAGRAVQYYQPAPAINPNPDPNVPVYARPRPDYDPIGVRLGSFFLFPELFAGVAYDSNVNASEEDEEGDFIFRLRPAASLQSNWNRHAVDAEIYLESGTYTDFDEYDYLDYGLRARGRYDISSAGFLRGDLRYDRLHESSDDPDNFRFDETIQYDRLRGQGLWRQRFGRFFTQLTGTLTQYYYDDDNDSRDRLESDGRLRGGYSVSPAIDAFVELAYLNKDYDNTSGDSDEWRGSVGAAFDITSILFGELYVGYSDVQFDNDVFDDTSGLSFGGSLVWNVTRLTTIDLNLTREFDATAVVGASTNYTTDVSLNVTHELRRNVLVSAGLGFTNDDYQGSEREDDTYRASVGVSYLLNRHFSIDAGYELSNRESSLPDSDYLRNLFTVGITARL